MLTIPVDVATRWAQQRVAYVEVLYAGADTLTVRPLLLEDRPGQGPGAEEEDARETDHPAD